MVVWTYTALFLPPPSPRKIPSQHPVMPLLLPYNHKHARFPQDQSSSFHRQAQEKMWGKSPVFQNTNIFSECFFLVTNTIGLSLQNKTVLALLPPWNHTQFYFCCDFPSPSLSLQFCPLPWFLFLSYLILHSFFAAVSACLAYREASTRASRRSYNYSWTNSGQLDSSQTCTLALDNICNWI